MANYGFDPGELLTVKIDMVDKDGFHNEITRNVVDDFVEYFTETSEEEPAEEELQNS